MYLYIADAFTDKPFLGNPAGVVLLDDNHQISKETMQLLAKELRFSETAFVKRKGNSDEFTVLFFTPVSEIDLCGHATIATFTVLREKGIVSTGKTYKMISRAGTLEIEIFDNLVMMEQAEPAMGDIVENKDIEYIAQALGIDPNDIGDTKYNLSPRPVTTGLWDLITPVKTKQVLYSLSPDFEKISDFCRINNIVSFHVFTLDEEKALANCRDFAPLYGIPEESATGTANGALIYYLYKHGVVEPEKTYEIIQGETMGRTSNIFAKIKLKDGIYKSYIGGNAKLIVEGYLKI
ncbi:PhzF family phenazine biosynthesis protein [Fervidobacterium nodosum]|uniref:Phenazine biosynthesis protein PhzF family n=1 Tax=Fervidobacterium nodosum (strain ATCC 35602 / DSM 5306 / Rt17-B1) TaxID=381764 RepID=A7HKB6_FERNB|nr:PhzF family phenazine biosynthesis protein [Fervidobacterium nodosum]ABS60349.1 phenazine biosynthesis protein PhzF family [Fervidobacterium nodosum Rt17-B1]PHJ13713.1 epimerase [Fervidobacterium sp. SC_NGM5_G05]